MKIIKESAASNMSNLRKMVRDNLDKYFLSSPKDAASVIFSKALDIGMGMPVSTMDFSNNDIAPTAKEFSDVAQKLNDLFSGRLDGKDSSATSSDTTREIKSDITLPEQVRRLLSEAYRKGTATNFSEFMSHALPEAEVEVHRILQERRSSRGTLRFISTVIWKIPVVIITLLLGLVSASQAGWSGAELVVNAWTMNPLKGLTISLVAFIGVAIAVGTVIFIQKIARPVLWLMLPALLYSAIVAGAWNGYVSDFDSTRLDALKNGFANPYALEQMSLNARILSCKDSRIELVEGAQTVCNQALNNNLGDNAPNN